MTKYQASCLCNSVKIAVKDLGESVGACHCGMCRKIAGGPMLAIDAGSEVQFDGKDSIGIYNSSDWAERGFCKNCGSGLFYRLKHNQHYHIPAGLFEEQNFKFDHQIFIDSKPDYYDFANETKNMTGQEVFEQAQSEGV